MCFSVIIQIYSSRRESFRPADRILTSFSEILEAVFAASLNNIISSLLKFKYFMVSYNV